jgi:hypothetical protein
VNVALAEEIIARILMDPERLHMPSYVGLPHDASRTVESLRQPECRTTACIAGWAALLTLPGDWQIHADLALDPDGHMHSIHNIGMAALDLTVSQADFLFNYASDDNAVVALKFIIGQPGATGAELGEFLDDQVD